METSKARKTVSGASKTGSATLSTWPARTHKGAENGRMGGRIMMKVVKGMGGSLAGNHHTHDHETSQNSENEECAR